MPRLALGEPTIPRQPDFLCVNKNAELRKNWRALIVALAQSAGVSRGKKENIFCAVLML